MYDTAPSQHKADGTRSTSQSEQNVGGYYTRDAGPYTLPVVPVPEDELLCDEDDSRPINTVVRRIGVTTSARDEESTSYPANSVSHDPTSSVQLEGSPNPDDNLVAEGSDRGTISDDNSIDETSEGLYSPSALFMRQCLPESAWEPDEATATCRQCKRRFSLFLRRHHCRRCGLVFCDSCSSKRSLLAAPTIPTQNNYYSQPPQSDDNTPLALLVEDRSHSTYWRFREHRVCRSCVETVDKLPAATTDSVALVVSELGSSDAAENAYNIFRPTNMSSGQSLLGQQSSVSNNAATVQRQRRHSSSSAYICPVCDQGWAIVWSTMIRNPGEGWQEAQERHIRECIEDTSAEMQGVSRDHPAAARRSRSIQNQPAHAQSPVDRAPISASQPRHSVGFLSFFDRTSIPEPDSVGSQGRQSQPDDDRIRAAGLYAPTSHQGRVARSPMGVKYVSYKLNSDTPLLGQECAICFEDFEPGQQVARLNCLCTYHLWCISDWLQRTPACPVHYE
ncbi:hypothetical protein H4S08_004641 [Coemansia sp. RSA 1365]|nr:hypothetical protein H4S08_004641 [Coemansia sp. RSA 1365]